MHQFAGPWESGDTASLSKKSLLTQTARFGGLGLTWATVKTTKSTERA